MKKSVSDFFASADPVLSFAALRAAGEKVPAALRAAALADPRVKALVERAAAWPWPALSSHKSAQQPFHALSFLAEIGFALADGGLGKTADKLLGARGEDGIPRIPINISEGHGGSGGPGSGWFLCDAPTVLYSLSRLGVPAKELKRGVKTVAELSFPKGWPCAAAPEAGSWRGPGKKTDPCPYATLISLKLLLEFPEGNGERAAAGAESLLSLWTRSREEHPYIFYMGSDFRKPKLPWIWYDIVHALEVLSRVPGIGKDKRFKEMLAVLNAAAGPEGFIPSTVYLPFKDWDFGQKKEASEWLGFARARIQDRLA